MGHQDDVRFYAAETARILDGWDSGDPDPPGRLVIVSGASEFGSTPALNDATAALEAAGHAVVLHTVHAGVPVPATAEQPEKAIDWAIQAAKIVGGGVAFGDPVLGGIILLAAEIATGIRMMPDAPELPVTDPRALIPELVQIIEQRAAVKPVALLIDHADQLAPAALWWNVLFGSQLASLVERLPVLCVLAIDRSSTTHDSPALKVVDLHLLPDGLATEVALEPLTRNRIATCLNPIEDALLDLLVPLAQSLPNQLAEIWHKWRDSGFIVRRRGRWWLASRKATLGGNVLLAWVETGLHSAVGDNDYRRARNVLAIAALEGPCFTAEAVAKILDEDVEILIDWIDDHLVSDDGSNLLREAGFVPRAQGTKPLQLRRYRFTSVMVAAILRQNTLVGSRGIDRAQGYARVLADLYASTTAVAPSWVIVQLARLGGDEKLVQTALRRANRVEAPAAAAEHARLWTDRLEKRGLLVGEQLLLATQISELMPVLQGSWNRVEICRFADTALRVARSLPESAIAQPYVDIVPVLIQLLTSDGVASSDRRERQCGELMFVEAAALSADRDDDLRTAGIYYHLAAARERQDKYEQALDAATSALGYAREVSTPSPLTTEALCHEVIARILAQREAGAEGFRCAAGHLAEASRKTRKAYRGHSLRRVDSPLSEIIGTAAKLVAYSRSDGQSVKLARAALRVPMKIGGQIHSLLDIATLLLPVDAQDAAAYAGRALRLAQVAEDPAWEAAALWKVACAGILAEKGLVFLVLALDRQDVLGPSDSKQISELQLRVLTAGNVLMHVRESVEKRYRSDRGASMLEETCGVQVEELDNANELVGDGSEEELRQYLYDVEKVCREIQAGEG